MKKEWFNIWRLSLLSSVSITKLIRYSISALNFLYPHLFLLVFFTRNKAGATGNIHCTQRSSSEKMKSVGHGLQGKYIKKNTFGIEWFLRRDFYCQTKNQVKVRHEEKEESHVPLVSHEQEQAVQLKESQECIRRSFHSYFFSSSPVSLFFSLFNLSSSSWSGRTTSDVRRGRQWQERKHSCHFISVRFVCP